MRNATETEANEFRLLEDNVDASVTGRTTGLFTAFTQCPLVKRETEMGKKRGRRKEREGGGSRGGSLGRLKLEENFARARIQVPSKRG